MTCIRQGKDSMEAGLPGQQIDTTKPHPARMYNAYLGGNDALPDGSYLALSHGTQDFHPPGAVSQAASAYQNATAPLVLRRHQEVGVFFEGFDLVAPGLVQAHFQPEVAGQRAGVGGCGGALAVGAVGRRP
jgi:hypothetical protein